MTLRFTVLGGSAAVPNPGQGCSAYLVRDDTTTVLLDCGPDTLLELRKHVDFRGIDAILISHCHADHILDLVTLRYGLVYGPGGPYPPIPLWLPPGGIAIIDALGQALGSQGEDSADFWRESFELVEYDPSASLDIGSLTVRFAATQHFTECYAMRVSAPGGQSLVYGADTGNIEPLVGFAEGAGLLVAEATADDYGELMPEKRGHITPEDAGAWASRARVERLLITHLWHERDPASVVRRAATRFDGPIDIASVGQTLYV